MASCPELLEDLLATPYIWPGGYARHGVTDDSAVLCHDCLKAEAGTIRDSDPGSGWHLEGWIVNWEDPLMICGHCNQRIAPEYELEAD